MQLDARLLLRETGARRYAYRGGLVASEELVARLQQDGELAAASNTTAIAFDDSSLLACAGEDSCVRLYLPESNQLLHSFDPVRTARHSRRSSGGGVSSGGTHACAQQLTKLHPLHRLQGHTEPIMCAEFLPGTGGSLLITAGPAKDVSGGVGGSCCMHRAYMHEWRLPCFRHLGQHSHPFSHAPLLRCCICCLCCCCTLHNPAAAAATLLHPLFEPTTRYA